MAADLIIRATSTPGCYVFSELLYHPNVQSLGTHPEYLPYLKHLQIFTYGTYHDYYTSTDPPLPQLSDAQTLKLRQLSLLSLASDRAALSYANLQDQMGLSSPRELEEVVISAVYANLLEATLDPQRMTVCITSISPLRDIAPGNMLAIQKGLSDLSDRCTKTLSKLEREIARIRVRAVARAEEKERSTMVLDRLVQAEKSIQDNSTANAGGGGGDGGGSTAEGASGAPSPDIHPVLSRKAKRSALGQEDDGGAMDLDDDDDGGEKKRGRKKF